MFLMYLYVLYTLCMEPITMFLCLNFIQERLDEHIANHKFFRCEECNISFTQNHKYQKHMQTAR